ncbi:hypothetical protein GOBAR_DD00085 [Gossypium barbadense]|nr:hypothetical protein GOBAR_DD00085 [Gossypium barbadense]
MYFKKTAKHVGEPMSHLESIASSAVRAAIKVKASVIICFTSSGRVARLIAKYRPTMPALSVVIPCLKTNQLKWSFSGGIREPADELAVDGRPSQGNPSLSEVFSLCLPTHDMLLSQQVQQNESVLKVALDHG